MSEFIPVSSIKVVNNIEPNPEISKLKKGEILGRGGDKVCFAVDGTNDLVLLESSFRFISSDQAYAEHLELMKYENRLPHDVNVARIINVEKTESCIQEVQEKAIGRKIHDRKDINIDSYRRGLEILALIPLSHYTKLVRDLRIIELYGLRIDPSKPDNIFYDKDLGFTFIDLEVANDTDKKGRSLIVPLLYTYNINTRFRDMLSKKDIGNIKTIIEKLKQAGDTHDDEEINTLLGHLLDK